MFGKKKIAVDFGSFSKERSKELIANKISLSLLMSEKFLNHIPEKMDPTEAKNNRLEFEMMSEGFLYFIIGARDALLQKINKDLQLKLDEDKVRLDTILEKLDKTDQTQKLIYKLLNDATQLPRRNDTVWDRSKSWLWELNYIRNRIGHRNILSSALVVVAGAGESISASLIVYQPREDNPNNQIKEAKPKEYYTKGFEKFSELKNKIDELIES